MAACINPAAAKLTDYVFGAVGEHDRVEIERHLYRCSVCRNEHHLLADGIAELAFSYAEKAPEGIRDAVFAQIDAEDARRYIDDAEHRRRTRNKVKVTLGYAATAVAGVFAFVAVSIVGSVEPDIAFETSVIEHPNFETADRFAQTAAIEAGEHHVTLTATDIPAPPPDRIYTLWTIRDGEPVNIGSFTPQQDGTVIHLWGMAPQDGDTFVITIERLPGAAEPSTQPVYTQTL